MTDSGAKAMGSLFDLLLDFVDSSRAHDSNYDIAQCLVRNYSQLAGLSLRDMASLCYVSPASFSRFCRHLGFENFAEFKDAMSSANYRLSDDYTREFLSELAQDSNAALASYRSTLVDLINTTLDDKNLAVVPQVLDAIEHAQRVVFFSHHFLRHIGNYFQSKMLLLGKYVELYESYAHQREAAQSLQKGDVAIVFSINGTYFSHYVEIAREIFDGGATVVALTQNPRAMYINRVDYLLSCGNTNENDLGKYAALMCVDYLVMSYLRRREQQLSDGAANF